MPGINVNRPSGKMQRGSQVNANTHPEDKVEDGSQMVVFGVISKKSLSEPAMLRVL